MEASILVSTVTSIRASQVTYQIVMKEVLAASIAGMGP